jgi:hypothetical protein
MTRDDLCGVCRDRARRVGSTTCAACQRVVCKVTASTTIRVMVTGAITADLTRRTLTGTVYRYGETGHTSAGPLAVGTSMPPPPVGLMATEEHDRGIVRGAIALVDNSDERLRIAVRVVDGELGDRALAEALDRSRAAWSLDIEDAVVVDGVIVDGRWMAVGQVAQPAFNSARIDQIAASRAVPNLEGSTMQLTPEQLARMAELIMQSESASLSTDEQAELDALRALAELYPPAEQPAEPAAAAVPEPATQAAATEPATPAVPAATTPVAAAMPSIPGGVPQLGRGGARRSATQTRSRNQFWTPGDLSRFVEAMVDNAPQGAAAITAALADITHTDHSSIIEPPAWSGELWDGVEYEPIWTDLFSQGELTNFEGKGWRWVTKMVMQDYAGDKVAIPTSTVETEPSSYEAARQAVGVDIDRKFFDFNNAANQAFLAALPEQARESWAINMDGKVRAYALAQAIAAEGVGAQPTLLKAAAVAIRALRRRRVIGRNSSTWVVVNDDDLMTLMDYNQLTVPAFLDLWGVDPNNFRSDQDVPAGTVVAGARQAATFRTLPGSPLRFDAQNLVNGGVDEAFFGYWAIEEHHTSGIAKATYTEPVEA